MSVFRKIKDPVEQGKRLTQKASVFFGEKTENRLRCQSLE